MYIQFFYLWYFQTSGFKLVLTLAGFSRPVRLCKMTQFSWCCSLTSFHSHIETDIFLLGSRSGAQCHPYQVYMISKRTSTCKTDLQKSAHLNDLRSTCSVYYFYLLCHYSLVTINKVEVYLIWGTFILNWPKWECIQIDMLVIWFITSINRNLWQVIKF